MVGPAVERAVSILGASDPRVQPIHRAVPIPVIYVNAYAGGPAGTVDRDFRITDVEYNERRRA